MKNVCINYVNKNAQVAFLLSSELANRIRAWDLNLTVPKSKFGSCDGNRNLMFHFTPIKSDYVHIWITHPYLSDRFQTSEYAQELSDLVNREQKRYTYGNSQGEDLIFKIEEKMYQILQKWQNWVNTEAFTPRYTYGFTDNSTFDLEYMTISDNTLKQTLTITLNTYTGELFASP